MLRDKQTNDDDDNCRDNVNGPVCHHILSTSAWFVFLSDELRTF